MSEPNSRLGMIEYEPVREFHQYDAAKAKPYDSMAGFEGAFALAGLRRHDGLGWFGTNA